MKKITNKLLNLRLFGLVLCGLLLSPYSYSQEVVTGPFLIRGDTYYHQDTNEPVTGIIEKFYNNGQLWGKKTFTDRGLEGLYEAFYENGQLESRGNFIDGRKMGLWEFFDEDENLIKTETWENGEFLGSN